MQELNTMCFKRKQSCNFYQVSWLIVAYLLK